MEVVASVIGSILAEPCRIIYGRVYAGIKNFFKRRSNFNALKKNMSSLIRLRDDLKQRTDLQDHVPRAQIKDWLRQINEFETQVEALLSVVSRDDNIFQYSCSPRLLQCRLSCDLARKVQEVKQLVETGSLLEKMLRVSNKVDPVEHIPAPSILGQKTASKNLATLSDLLSDDDVTRIGVWGMGGVGKTTLVKNLNNQLREALWAQAFSIIIWMTASKETNLRRIQIHIAERLNLEVNMEYNEERMAIRLHNRLLKERRFLLILDDVWEDIDLDRVGIPRPELCARSKIIITSRSLDVCREMITQVNLEVKVLNNDEAWELFCKHAGEVVMEEHIRPLAEVVAKECDGLPLAVIVVGASMRGKSVVALWKDALRTLQMSVPLVKGIKDKVFKTLKWSYDSLPSKHTKFCFLFCCLYPEDYNIRVRELVRYWYCEGLLDEHLDYEELENRGITIIHSLSDCCLLEYDRGRNMVKMHDVVRDVGIWIACSIEDECCSLVRSGIGLTCVSEKEFLYSHKRVSFMHNEIDSLPDCIVQCQEASTLLFQGNWKLETLPSSFIEGFQALKILDLSGSRITSLPSLFHLHQLRALLLRGCRFLTELPPLDGLSRLVVLDCGVSGITQLPESLEKLSNLRQLDISHTPNLQIIPYRAISRLGNLEFLKMSCVGSERSVHGQRLFEELAYLKQLIVLYADLDIIPHLISNDTDWFGNVKRFRIVIGDRDLSRCSPLIVNNSIIIGGLYLSQESIGWLLHNAATWVFVECGGITQMFKMWAINNISFSSLRVLILSDSNTTFQAAHEGRVVASSDLLPNLETVDLHNLSKLGSISDLSKLLSLQFSKLRTIVITNCPQLKCLFSLEENQTLEKLEEIHVQSCEMLNCLLNIPNTRQYMNPSPTVPNLRIVTLMNLPNLGSLCRDDESWDNLQQLNLFCCHEIRKLPFTAQNTCSIKEIRGEQEWWNQLEWDSEDTKMLVQNHFIAIDHRPWFYR